jgi:hypothetical protein
MDDKAVRNHWPIQNHLDQVKLAQSALPPDEHKQITEVINKLAQAAIQGNAQAQLALGSAMIMAEV